MRLSAPSIIALFDGGFVKGGFRIDIAPSYANSLLPILRLILATLGTVPELSTVLVVVMGVDVVAFLRIDMRSISTSKIVDKNGWWLLVLSRWRGTFFSVTELAERARICCPPLPYGLIGWSLLPSSTARSSDLGWSLRQWSTSLPYQVSRLLHPRVSGLSGSLLPHASRISRIRLSRAITKERFGEDAIVSLSKLRLMHSSVRLIRIFATKSGVNNRDRIVAWWRASKDAFTYTGIGSMDRRIASNNLLFIYLCLILRIQIIPVQSTIIMTV